MNTQTMASQGALADISQRANDGSREKLLADLKTIASDADALLKQVADFSVEGYAAARAGLESKLLETRERLIQVRATLDEKARRAAEASEAYVREHPWKSLSGAMAIGVVLGFVLGKVRE